MCLLVSVLLMRVLVSHGPLQVIAVHRVLDICVQLRELRDLMTLKALWAAVGTVVAQQHLTHLSWNVRELW